MRAKAPRARWAAAALLAWGLAGGAHAQSDSRERDDAREQADERALDDERDESRLEKITVTASRVPRALSDLPISVTQIEEPELRTQLATSSNVLESLDVLVPGLTASQEEARMGCRTNIRGRQAQFLINGVPTNDNLRRSSCSSLYGISPFALERIEVVRGATALFGAGAPGGAINLVTRQGRTAEATVDAIVQVGVNPHATGGSAESNVYAGVGQERGDFDYYVGLGLQDYGLRRNPDDGILPGEEFRSGSLNAAFGWTLGAGELRVTVLEYSRNPDQVYGTDFTQVSGEQLAGSAFVANPPNPFAHEAEVEQSVWTAAYTIDEVLGHSLDVSLYHHDERLVQRAADFFEGEVFYFDTDAENERLGLRTTLNRGYALGDGALDFTYGLDLLDQRYYRPEVDPAAGGRVIGFISPEVELSSAALFVQPTYRTGDWLFTGGVRHERFDGEIGGEGYDPSIPRAAVPGEIPDFDLTLFNLGVVYDLDDAMQLYAGFNQGAEIAEFGRAARGASDPSLVNLDGATSDQVEVGVRGRRGRVEFDVAAFRSSSDKAASLQADPSCAGEPICPLIPLRLEQDIVGLEATVDVTLGDRTRVGGILTWQEGEFESPGATPVDFGSDVLSPPRGTAYVAFEPIDGWQNRIQATYAAETDLYDAAAEADGFRDSGSVFLVDLSSSYRVGPGYVTLGIANLLNREYVNVTNQASGDFFYYLSEGTRVTLGYVARF